MTLAPSNPPVIGLVSGSFDPITVGHAYLVQEAARLVDKLYVVVGVNSAKRYFFTDQERVALVQAVVDDMALGIPVEVVFSKDRFLVDVATELGATHLIRGIRNPLDFTYEAEMAQVNRDINPNLYHVYVLANPELAKVSSSTVRGMMGLSGWERRAEPYVHPQVMKALSEKAALAGKL